MTGGEVYNNFTDGVGGGIHASYQGIMEISGGSFHHNSAIRQGGAINLNTGVSLRFPAGSTCKIYNNEAGIGGAVLLDGADLYIYDGEFYNNEALATSTNPHPTVQTGVGGAFCLVMEEEDTHYSGTVVPANFYMYGGDIHDNIAAVNGGGVFIAKNVSHPLSGDSHITIKGGQIRNNQATIGSGGGIYADAGCIFHMAAESGEIGHVQNNIAAQHGGGVYIVDADFTIEDGAFEANTAQQNGGGFYIAGSASDVKINGGIIQGNIASNGNGGGFYIAEGSLATIKGGTISGNKANNGVGGGFYVSPGTSKTTYIKNDATNTTISGNEAKQGAGAYVASGTVELGSTSGSYSTTMSGNQASQNGGGIYVQNGTVNVNQRAVLFGNTASNQGGGIYIQAGTFNLKGGTIGQDGSPNVSEKTGGGLYQKAGAFNMTSGSLSYNIGTTGGGGAFINGGNVSITGGSITGNSTGSSNVDGGGINANGGSVTVKNATFDGNEASGLGGGIYAKGSSTQVQIDPEGNGASVTRFQNNTASKGGGIYAQAQSVTVRHATFTHNTATSDGGGIYVKGPVTLNTGTSLVQNEAMGNGGAVYVDGNTFTMTDGVTIGGSLDNANWSKATSGNNNGGGGIYVKNSGSAVNIQGGEISYNTAWRYGGGLLMASDGGVTISGNAQVSHNGAVRGGGIFVTNGTVNISGTGVGVSQNTASQSGGGIYQDAGSITLTSAKVEGNTATSGDGGGLYLGNGTITISAAKVSGNNATNGKGGGIYASIDDNNNNNNGTTIIVKDGAQIGTYDAKAGSGNQANQGGGLYVNKGKMVFSQGTFRGNQANQGGGIYINDGAELNMKQNAEITDNTVPADGVGGGIYLGGVLEVGENASDAPGTHSLKVKNNLAGTVEHNVYLPTDDNYITLKSDIATSSTNIGITVDGSSKRRVVYVEDESNQKLGWLNALISGTSLTGAIFDDTQSHIAIHTNRDINGYDNQFIYLTGCWTTMVNSDPEGEDAHAQYPLPSGVSAHYTVDGQGVWHIYTSEGLSWFSSYVNGLNAFLNDPHRDADAVLENDINMSANIWVPLGAVYYDGDHSTFAETGTDVYGGTFNGQGHIVKGIECGYLTGISRYGLFGALGSSSSVTNTLLDEYTFLAVNDGQYYLGGVSATTEGSATISNCEARGAMDLVECNENSAAGGLVGVMQGNSSVHSSMAMPEFADGAPAIPMGGIAGQTAASTSVKNCYANLKLGSTTGIGGLVGTNAGTVENCYVRLQQGSSAPASWFAASGEDHVDYCYAPAGTPAGTNGTYAGTSLDNGKYGFAQSDQQVTASNGYVENGAIDNQGNLYGLLRTLNNWVKTQTDGVAYSTWTRTMASPINGDLPILEFNDFVCAGSTDNVFIAYKDNLNDMIAYANGDAAGGSIYLYKTNPSTVSTNTSDDVRVYIPENIGVKQEPNNKINARVGVTFDNSDGSTAVGNQPYDWHMFSSSLTAAPLGITYNYGDALGYGVEIQSSHITLTGEGYFPSQTPFASFDFYSFYEPEYHWINFKRKGNDHWHTDGNNGHIDYNEDVNETELVQGKGYLLAVNQPTMLTADGRLNNQAVTYRATASNSESGNAVPFKGVNLLGNPYQSYLDFNAFVDGNGNSGFNTYYILDADARGYIAYTSGQTPSEADWLPGVMSYGADRYIHPHQGFFVMVGATTDLSFDPAMGSANGNGSTFRGETPCYPLVRLMCTDAKGLNDFATVELGRPEQGGGEKAKGLHAGNASIWMHLGDTDYQTAFATEGTTTVPVRFKAYEDGTFTLRWGTANGEFSYLHLIDNLTGMDIDCLKTDSYVFEGKTEDYLSRFKLVFDYTGVEEGESDITTGSFAFQMGDELIVNGEGALQLFDVNGRCLLSTELHDAQNTVSLPRTAGVYVLRLTSGSQVKVQKMVVR